MGEKEMQQLPLEEAEGPKAQADGLQTGTDGPETKDQAVKADQPDWRDERYEAFMREWKEEITAMVEEKIAKPLRQIVEANNELLRKPEKDR